MGVPVAEETGQKGRTPSLKGLQVLAKPYKATVLEPNR